MAAEVAPARRHLHCHDGRTPSVLCSLPSAAVRYPRQRWPRLRPRGGGEARRAIVRLTRGERVEGERQGVGRGGKGWEGVRWSQLIYLQLWGGG